MEIADQIRVLKRAGAEDRREAMRSGVHLRAQTFRAKKGKGSYTRKQKHRVA